MFRLGLKIVKRGLAPLAVVLLFVLAGEQTAYAHANGVYILSFYDQAQGGGAPHVGKPMQLVIKAADVSVPNGKDNDQSLGVKEFYLPNNSVTVTMKGPDGNMQNVPLTRQDNMEWTGVFTPEHGGIWSAFAQAEADPSEMKIPEKWRASANEQGADSTPYLDKTSIQFKVGGDSHLLLDAGVLLGTIILAGAAWILLLRRREKKKRA